MKQTSKLSSTLVLGAAIAFGLGIAPALAQQLPQFSQFTQAANTYNPAVAGMEDFLAAKTGFRNQYTGTGGGPQTLYVNVHGALNQRDLNKDDLGALPMRGASSIRFKTDDLPRKVRHGLGGSYINDKTQTQGEKAGFNTHHIQVAYAYHLPIGKKYYWSYGAHAGVSVMGLNADWVNLRDGQQADRVLGATKNLILPRIGLGTMFYSDRFYIGLSADQLLQSKYKFGDNSISTANQQNVHYYLNAGVRINLNEEFDVIPQALIKYSRLTPAIDVQAKVRYQRNFYAGVGYRNASTQFSELTSDAATALVGFTYANLLDIGFAYDFTTSALSTATNGTYELTLGARLFNKKAAPAKLW